MQAQDLLLFQAALGLSEPWLRADEAHTYWGAAFSTAVRELYPQMQIGLTATPHPPPLPSKSSTATRWRRPSRTRLVKTPVLVGCKDDLSDPETKLLDGIALERKEQAIERYCKNTGAEPVGPLMLVVAQSIGEANELRDIIVGESFAGGRYTDRVLTVHSDAADAALEALESVGAADSPYRVVISVAVRK